MLGRHDVVSKTNEWWLLKVDLKDSKDGDLMIWEGYSKLEFWMEKMNDHTSVILCNNLLILMVLPAYWLILPPLTLSVSHIINDYFF